MPLPEILRRLNPRYRRFKVDYAADGVGVRGKTLAFLDEPDFARGWAAAERLNAEGWEKAGGVPDVRWRAHVCVWAASNCLRLKGDFVECGVHTGLFALSIINALGFREQDRQFWLFDTFEGIPLDTVGEADRDLAAQLNTRIYSDVYALAMRNFADVPNARLVKGLLPATLDASPIGDVAFLSIDLNNAEAERSCIVRLWDRLVPGAMVVIDDYAFAGHEPQYAMWNEFAAAHDRRILTLPTGQGLLVR